MLKLHERSEQRRIVVKSILDLLRTVCRAYFKDDAIGDHATELIVGLALVLGQSEGRPMTASDLSNYTGTSRTTVSRAIRKMESRGAVAREKQGRRVVFWLTRVNDPDIVSEVFNTVRIIQQASFDLTKTVN